MPQWTYTKKPSWYPSNKVEATAAGWAHTDTGELLVAIGGLDTLNTDAADEPTFTLTLPADGSYTEDDVLEFVLEASEPVHAQGSVLPITFYSGKVVNAVFDAAASDEDSINYKYTVTAEDMAFPMTAAAIQAAGTGYTVGDVLTAVGGVGSSTSQVTVTNITKAVASVTIEAGGTGYTVDDVLTVVGGTGTAATLTVTSVSGGVVDGVSVTTGGAYSVSPTNPVDVTGGTGADATFNLTMAATGPVAAVSLSRAGLYTTAPTNPVSVTGGSGANATFNLTKWDGQILSVADTVDGIFDVVGTDGQLHKPTVTYVVGALTGILISQT